jgi:uncharacterized Tic20 family protein
MEEKEEIPEPAQNPESEIPPAQEGRPGSKEINKDARMWAMWCHLSGLAGLLPVIPGIGCVIAPLIIWQMKKEVSPFVDENGKEALNFQISILIYGVVAGLLIFACVGIVLLPAVVVFDIVFLIIAALKANSGEHYRYPLTIRFVK